MTVLTRVTADQLAAMPDDGNRWELIAGELRKMTPAGWKHGAIAGRLHGWLHTHVAARSLGMVLAAETGFRLARDPDTVRAPDVAFLRQDHLPDPLPDETYWPGAPDLAVEVVSPNDRSGEIDEKVKAWLNGGCRMVWLVNPAWRTVTVYRSATQITTLTENEELSGEDVVQGFRCPVGDIFADLAGPSAG
ncbi:MAG: Uma2 family endonuclease [Thermoguttaceae bacterium]